MSLPVLIKELTVHNELGEGILWDARRKAIWWTDIQRCRMYRYLPASDQLDSFQTPERLGCFAPVAGKDVFIAAFASGFAYFDPFTGRVDWLQTVDKEQASTRLNDGRTDRQGRFWAGSLVEGDRNTGVTGALYCVDHQQRCERKVGGLLISNGLCFSPDSAWMYHTDTTTARIDRYEFNATTGDLGERSTFVASEGGCWPDGACVDASGFVWSAQWGGGKVCRYSPDGKLDIELLTPASQPTCVAFGGPKLDLLFVSSANQDLDQEALKQQPGAGNVFVYQTNYTGLADAEYRVAQ